MTRTILTYGSIAGFVLIALFYTTFLLSGHEGPYGALIGFLTMFAALSFVFVGVKRYRDNELGGVIRFWPALKLGLGIALVASIFYVLGWEVYMYLTDYSFMDEYTAVQANAMREGGASPGDIAAMERDMAVFAESYANPLYRMAITLMEISPVVVIVSLASAALLRNPRFLPASAPASY